jgi:hypothetical protein
MRGMVWNNFECGLQDSGLTPDSGDFFIFTGYDTAAMAFGCSSIFMGACG